MALKFLNKKGWHTGSLRNIENVWKAEQKHDAEQKKLEELRKQIHEERERSEFRQIQEAAGLVPRQERLDFLYESRLAVGKGSSEGFKALQDQPSGGAPPPVAAESSSSKAVVPGALFEDKLQSANDAWRKLHTDPLLLIRQKEQEALARIKNNPIRMAIIRNSIKSKKREDKKEHRTKRNKHKLDQRKSQKDEDPFKSRSNLKRSSENRGNSDDNEDWRNAKKGDIIKGNNTDERYKKENKKQEKHLPEHQSKYSSVDKERRVIDLNTGRRKHLEHGNYSSREHSGDKHAGSCEKERSGENRSTSDEKCSYKEIYPRSEQASSVFNRRQGVPRMSEEEREARLQEMQMDAELHEGQRWKRLKKAAEADALEANQATYSRGKSFLNATQKCVYGMEKGSSTIEESLRRRAYYSQGQSDHERNAFRR